MGLFGALFSSNKASTNNTSTQSTYNDQRSVVDAGGGVAGTGNFWDQSIRDSGNQTWQQANSTSAENSGNTTWNSDSRSSQVWDWKQDSSNSGNTSWKQDTNNSGNTTWNSDARQTWDWKQDTNNSGNTTWNSDARQTWDWKQDTNNSGNTTTTLNTIDGGAVRGMTEVGLSQADLAGKIAQITATNAERAGSTAAGAAVRAQESALSAIGDAINRALTFATNATAQATKSQTEALGLGYQQFDKLAAMTGALVKGAQTQADSAGSSVQAAYSSAASQANGNKTLTIAALAVVGVIGAALIFKK
jgi:hypothetical protein